MQLKEYLKAMPWSGQKHEIDAFAKRCGTTSGQLKQVANGYRRASANLAISIERETCGLVSCEVLRPDIDWQYIRESKALRA